MARLRVLGENPPPPRGDVSNQLRELRDYLTRLKDELEFLMLHLDEDNMERAFLASKQDTLTFDAAPTAGSPDAVSSGAVYDAVTGPLTQVTLFEGTAVDVHEATSSDPVTVTLSDSAWNYKLLAVTVHNLLTTGSRRGVILVQPRFAYIDADYPVATNGSVGYVRMGVNRDEPDKLVFSGCSFTSATYCVRVFGYR